MQTIRRLAADPRRRAEGMNLCAVRRRHPALLAAVYAVRPFWGWRQALADAGLDPVAVPVELLDHVTCQICGQTTAMLTTHLARTHAITPAEYRHEFPGADIIAETIRAARSLSACHLAGDKPPLLPHWEPLWTPEYVLDRVAELARQGVPLHSSWIGERERGLLMRAITFHGSWDAALVKVGLSPAAIRRVVPGYRRNAAKVVADLRARQAANRPMNETAMIREDMCLLNAARRRFGSYSKALTAAHIDPASVRLRPGFDHTVAPRIEQLLAEVRSLVQMSDEQRQRQAWAQLQAKYQPLVSSQATRGLGGWRKVFQLAGVSRQGIEHLLVERPCRRPYVGRPAVLAALRERLARGEPVNANAVFHSDRPLFSEVLRQFGGSFTPVYALLGLPTPKMARHKAAHGVASAKRRSNVPAACGDQPVGPGRQRGQASGRASE